MKSFVSTIKGKIILAGVLVAVIACVLVAVVMVLQSKSYRSIKVKELTGQTIISSEKAENQDAYQGMELKSGQKASVQEESNMTLLLDMDKYVFADAGANFFIEATGNENNSNTKIVMEKGSVLYRLDSKLAEDESFTVDTPNTAMAVRGTVFVVSVYQDVDGITCTRVDALDGSVKVSANEEERMLEAGYSVLVKGVEDVSFSGENMLINYSNFSQAMTEFITETMASESSDKGKDDVNVSEDTEGVISQGGTSGVLSKEAFRQVIENEPKIRSIHFLSSLETMPNDGSVDVSEAKDASVMLWMVPNGTLLDVYVGANGKVTAPELCNGLFNNRDQDGNSYWQELGEINFNDAFDTSNVSDMGLMFGHCSNLTTLDLSSFDTSKVGRMGSMFFSCSNLTTLDLSGFDTSNATDMSAMFRKCSSLTTLDVSNFDTSKVTDMSFMFTQCSGLTSLDISHFNMDNVTSKDFMFMGTSLE